MVYLQISEIDTKLYAFQNFSLRFIFKNSYIFVNSSLHILIKEPVFCPYIFLIAF